MNNQKKQLNKWLALINIPVSNGIDYFCIFFYLGSWLDETYENSSKIYFKVFTLIGVFVAIFQVINQVKQINKKSSY